MIASLIEDHRKIEAALDRFAESLDPADVKDLLTRHNLREEEFLNRLQTHEPGLAAKLRAQHEEALELAAALEASADTRDVPYLARRFVAIIQHNIIEEERDVFPLAARILTA